MRNKSHGIRYNASDARKFQSAVKAISCRAYCLSFPHSSPQIACRSNANRDLDLSSGVPDSFQFALLSSACRLKALSISLIPPTYDWMLQREKTRALQVRKKRLNDVIKNLRNRYSNLYSKNRILIYKYSHGF